MLAARPCSAIPHLYLCLPQVIPAPPNTAVRHRPCSAFTLLQRICRTTWQQHETKVVLVQQLAFFFGLQSLWQVSIGNRNLHGAVDASRSLCGRADSRLAALSYLLNRPSSFPYCSLQRPWAMINERCEPPSSQASQRDSHSYARVFSLAAMKT